MQRVLPAPASPATLVRELEKRGEKALKQTIKRTLQKPVHRGSFKSIDFWASREEKEENDVSREKQQPQTTDFNLPTFPGGPGSRALTPGLLDPTAARASQGHSSNTNPPPRCHHRVGAKRHNAALTSIPTPGRFTRFQSSTR